MVKMSDLRMREVVNVHDGRRLGLIKDVEIDLESGRIAALILPGSSKLMGFLGRDEEVIVLWEKIVRIGMDVILVEAPNYADSNYQRR